MSGVVTLAKHGMFPIAAVVFIASILVPTFKLVGIAMLLISVQRHHPMSPRQRILVFRFIEWIGRWSMLDIFVIAILVAIVNLQSRQRRSGIRRRRLRQRGHPDHARSHHIRPTSDLG